MEQPLFLARPRPLELVLVTPAALRKLIISTSPALKPPGLYLMNLSMSNNQHLFGESIDPIVRSGKPAPKKKSWRQDTSLKCIHCRRSKQKCIFEDPSHFCRLCVKTKKPICGPKLTAPADKSRRADDENESSQWKKVKECIQRRRNRGESWDDVFHLLDPDSKQTAKQNSVPFSPNIPFSINAGLNVPDNMQFEEMPWEPYSHIPPISYPLGTQTDSNIPNSFDRAMIPISMTGTSHGIGLISEQEVEMLLNGVEIGEDMERFESWEGS